MKDKVFVRIADDDNFGTASVEPRQFAEPYLRKDALLEWLRREHDLVDFHLKAQPEDAVWWGQRNAFQQVIDKLNKM